MTSISDLYNGVGILYCVNASGRIVAADKNIKATTRLFRDIGETVQPIAAQKASSARITVSFASGAGNITAITINGINQLGSTIIIASTNEATVAAQITTAINAYTPAGIKFTSQNEGDVAVLFAPEQLGSSPNGTTISITSSGGSTFSVTVFGGGSSETGFVDTGLQRRFYLNSSPTAPASSFAAAIDITKYIVSRGMQVGMITREATLASDGITGLDRGSAFTTINMRPQTGSSDTLAYINTDDFIEGDFVYLASPSGFSINVESAPATTSLSTVKNLYLKDNNSFTVDQFNTLAMQYRYDTALGGILIELGRSIPDPSFDVEITRAAALALMSGEGVVKGTRYLIYNVGDGLNLASGNAGIILTGATTSLFTNEGTFLAKVVNRTLVPTMWTGDLTPIAGDRVEDWNGVYQNSTGVNTTTHPAGDTANWTYLPRSVVYYNDEMHSCIYDITNDIIRARADLRGNVVANATTIVSANELILQGFRWGTDLWYGNKVQFTQAVAGLSAGTLPNDTQTFFMSNLQGSVFNNVLLNQIQCYILATTALTANFYQNIVSLGITIFDTNAGEASDNVLNYVEWTLDGSTQYARNNLFYSYLNTNTGAAVTGNTGGNASITGNSTIGIVNCTINNSFITNLTGFSTSTLLQQCDLSGSFITANTWQNDLVLGGLRMVNSTIQNCIFNINTKYNSYVGSSGIKKIQDSFMEGITIDGESTTNAFILLPVTGINKGTAPQYLYRFTIAGDTSDASAGIDYDTAYSAGTLTIPAGLDHIGELLLFNTRGGHISQIANLYPSGTEDNRGILQKNIRVVSGSGVTMEPVPVSGASGNYFASDGGNLTITRVQDFYTLKKVNGILYKINSLKVQ